MYDARAPRVPEPALSKSPSACALRALGETLGSSAARACNCRRLTRHFLRGLIGALRGLLACASGCIPRPDDGDAATDGGLSGRCIIASDVICPATLNGGDCIYFRVWICLLGRLRLPASCTFELSVHWDMNNDCCPGYEDRKQGCSCVGGKVSCPNQYGPYGQDASVYSTCEFCLVCPGARTDVPLLTDNPRSPDNVIGSPDVVGRFDVVVLLPGGSVHLRALVAGSEAPHPFPWRLCVDPRWEIPGARTSPEQDCLDGRGPEVAPSVLGPEATSTLGSDENEIARWVGFYFGPTVEPDRVLT